MFQFTAAESCPTTDLCLQGHKDWIFGVSWLTDRHVITGVLGSLQLAGQHSACCSYHNAHRLMDLEGLEAPTKPG